MEGEVQGQGLGAHPLIWPHHRASHSMSHCAGHTPSELIPAAAAHHWCCSFLCNDGCSSGAVALCCVLVCCPQIALFSIGMPCSATSPYIWHYMMASELNVTEILEKDKCCLTNQRHRDRACLSGESVNGEAEA